MSLSKSLTILDIHPTGFLSVWFGKGPITWLKIIRKIIVLTKTVFAINFFYSYRIKTERNNNFKFLGLFSRLSWSERKKWVTWILINKYRTFRKWRQLQNKRTLDCLDFCPKYQAYRVCNRYTRFSRKWKWHWKWNTRYIKRYAWYTKSEKLMY